MDFAPKADFCLNSFHANKEALSLTLQPHSAAECKSWAMNGEHVSTKVERSVIVRKTLSSYSLSSGSGEREGLFFLSLERSL